MGNDQEGVYTFCVLETLCHCVGTLRNTESRSTSSAQPYVFDSSMQAPVNMRCCSLDGLDREIVATVQRVPSQVNYSSKSASWRIQWVMLERT
jgi:hypothetical protein